MGTIRMQTKVSQTKAPQYKSPRSFFSRFHTVVHFLNDISFQNVPEISLGYIEKNDEKNYVKKQVHLKN